MELHSFTKILPEASNKGIPSIFVCIGKTCHYKNSKLHLTSLLHLEKISKIFRNCQIKIFSFSQTLVESEFGSEGGSDEGEGVDHGDAACMQEGRKTS